VIISWRLGILPLMAILWVLRTLVRSYEKMETKFSVAWR
jgi:hypothetical protein